MSVAMQPAQDAVIGSRLLALDPIEDRADYGDWIDRDIGPFHIDRLLGTAPDAATFLAHRSDADYAELVALKVLRVRLPDDLARHWFERERGALMSIAHRNLVRMIDGGLSGSGLPYIATEYVDGLQIARYCAETQISLCRRLQLFADVCRALDTAHRIGVVHGDVRPSNVLIDAHGVARVQNLGMAKLCSWGSAHHAGNRVPVSFPEYAAPELLQGLPASARTDAYALGVLLHELLLGVRPDRNDLRAPSQRALELTTDLWMLPTSQRALSAQLNGDVDYIVLKALQKDLQRRYASAGAIVDDVECVLAQWKRRAVAVGSRGVG
jgi:eukaryotic-like serine/threonine-protein kinase